MSLSLCCFAGRDDGLLALGFLRAMRSSRLMSREARMDDIVETTRVQLEYTRESIENEQHKANVSKGGGGVAVAVN